MTTETDFKFTVDWFSSKIPRLEKAIRGLKGEPIHALEIGVFEGASTVWLLQNILTHPDSRLTAVDTFEGSVEFRDKMADCVASMEETFRANIEVTGQGHRVETLKSYSFDALVQLNQDRRSCYDLIYVDGSHMSWDVLSDAVLSWPLLKPGGILVFDDYLWDVYPQEHKRPRLAIDSFLACYVDQLKIVRSSYQMIVRKR